MTTEDRATEVGQHMVKQLRQLTEIKDAINDLYLADRHNPGSSRRDLRDDLERLYRLAGIEEER